MVTGRIGIEAEAREGNQFFTGDVIHGNVHYQVLCRRHYRAGQLGPDER
jgi:hypothetical protein